VAAVPWKPHHATFPRPRLSNWTGAVNASSARREVHVVAHGKLAVRAVSRTKPSTGGCSGFVASTAAPIATGRSDPVPGRAFLPAVDQRLFTAHCNGLLTAVDFLLGRHCDRDSLRADWVGLSVRFRVARKLARVMRPTVALSAIAFLYLLTTTLDLRAQDQSRS
jgi:hypothetical protein